MATNMTGKVLVDASWTYDNLLNLSTTTDQSKKTYTDSFTFGTGSKKVKVLFHDERSVSATTSNDDLDLAGVLKDAFGDTITFAKVKAVVIYNLSTTSGNNLVVGNATANAFSTPFGAATHTIKVPPAVDATTPGMFVLTNPQDGFVVTAGTADILRIAFSGSGSISYDIIIFGE
jgi:hypothetical protein